MDVDPIQNFLKYEQAVAEGWERLTWVREEQNQWGEYITETSKLFNRKEILEWCEARCKGPWVVLGGTALIKNPKEAMLFKLTFYDNDCR